MWYCGRNQLGSSKLEAKIPIKDAFGSTAPKRREPQSPQKPRVCGSSRFVRRRKISRRSLCQLERLGRHKYGGRIRPAGGLLTIAAMAKKHLDWGSGAFITNRAAGASALKRKSHKIRHSPRFLICEFRRPQTFIHPDKVLLGLLGNDPRRDSI
jgi:hypothetical protein